MSVRVKAGSRVSENQAISKASDYGLLIKLRLTSTVVFSSVMAYLITVPTVKWFDVLILAAGGFLVTGAANSLNQVLEKDFDRLMKRTKDRPIAACRMSQSEGVMAAGFMSMVGITLLALFNPWTAFLGTLAMVLYAFVYTPLKRISPVAVFVGAIAGALPVLIGCVAAEGRFTGFAILLFSIQFFWQFPHFWSIAWLGFDDYKKAGYKFVPEQNGRPDISIGLQSLLYSLFLMGVIGIAYGMGRIAIGPAIIAILVSIGFSILSYRFYRNQNRKSALALMFYSLGYIPLVLLIFLIDKIVF